MRVLQSLAFATSFAIAAVPAAAQDLAFRLDIPDAVPKKEVKQQQFAEAHDGLLLDASGSVKDDEIITIFDGVREYYTSDEAQTLYDAGLCIAATIIFYGERAMVKPTYIVCSREDAERFVAENVDLVHISEVRSYVGRNATRLDHAMNEAVNLFERGDVATMRKRVVIVSDAPGSSLIGSNGSLSQISQLLSYKHGAVTNGVAIGRDGESVRQFFVESVVTPPQSKYMEPQYNGSYIERPVAAGMAFAATDSTQVKDRLQTVLTLGGF